MAFIRRRKKIWAARLVDTKVGLYFEWGLKWRARVNETEAVVADIQFAANLRQNLIDSDWVAPPCIKSPKDFPVTSHSPNQLDLQTIQQAWTQSIIQRYGYDALRLGLQIFPHSLNLFQLSQIKSQKKVLQERLKEHPNMGPLLSVDQSMWSSLTDWKSVKSRFIAMGLLNRTWRWLCQRSPAYIAQIDWTQLSQIAWVNLHACVSLSKVAHYVDRQTAAIEGFGSLGTWVRSHHEHLHSSHCVSVLRAIRLCIEHLEQADNENLKKEIILEELPLIADWLKARIGINRSNREIVGRNWTYSTLINKQAHWHLADLIWLEPNQDVFWPEHLGGGDIFPDTYFVELTSLNALLKEARKMHHCVPSYIDRCISGDVVLFHLCRTGRKLERATLEVSRSGASSWAVTQLKGPCNMPVSSTMWRRAKQILEKMLIR